jgi:Rrf2 family protein
VEAAVIFSRSTRYAIQALVLISVLPAGHYMRSRSLAARLRQPEAYLSKLMVRFAQAGILESSRGRMGGYRLRVSPHSVSLRQVADIISAGRMQRECLLGLKTCSEADACAMHGQWQPVKQRLFAMLEEQNLGRLAQDVASGRYRLEQLNVARLAGGMG